MRRLWGVLVGLLVLAGCSDEVSGAPQRTAPPTGAFDLATPIEFAGVAETASGDTEPLPDDLGATINVEREPFLTVERLEGIRVTLPEGSTAWALEITLTEEDGEVFSSWTEEHTGERAAMLVDGEVVSAPEISEPIPGREIVISAQFTRDEADALAHRLTGR